MSKQEKEERHATCFYCGGKLIWDNDEMASEVFPVYEEQDNAIVTCWHCDTCGRDYIICDPDEETRKKQYASYWITN